MKVDARDMLQLLHDAIDDHIAVINGAGRIVYVNRHWRKFAEENGCCSNVAWEECNYLDICEAAAQADAHARAALAGIRQVMAGETAEFALEYPCHGPDQPRWFLLRVKPVRQGQALYFLLWHSDITQRRLSEERTASRYQAFLEAMPDLFFLVDGEGRYLDCHASQAELLILPPEQFLGRSVHELLPRDIARSVQEAIDAVLRLRCLQVVNYQLDIQGRPMQFNARLVPCEDGRVLCIVRDVTRERETEERLAQLHQSYRAVVELQSELLCRYTADGTLTFVNPAYCRYFSRSADELLGSSFFPFLPPEDLAALRERLAGLCPARPDVVTRHRVYAADGIVRWQEWVDCAVFDRAGRVVEYQASGRDISERVAMEESLEQELRRNKLLVTEIRQQSERLERKNVALQVMLDHARQAEADLEERVAANIRLGMLPLLDRLASQGLPDPALLAELRGRLDSLAHPLARDLEACAHALTSREIQVAGLIMQGKSSKEIMARLGVSFATVESHRNNLRRKLGLKHRKMNLAAHLRARFGSSSTSDPS